MHDKKVSGFKNMNAKVRDALINIGIRQQHFLNHPTTLSGDSNIKKEMGMVLL